MKFSIVIPAYNEEKAIEDILARSLRAGQGLLNASLDIDQVEILVVNDGSKDRTADLAGKFGGVRILSHPQNRGYGAALKTGFESATGEILGFLDADGTCDPESFAPLLKLLKDKNLDLVVGSRIHKGSRMPWVRWVGNCLFQRLVRCIWDTEVTDIASGMRVFKRETLQRLYPLPDGLNFTPAMSARAVGDLRIRVGESPISYAERLGRSKLSVIQDGFRFLGSILDTAITYQPFKIYTFLGCVLCLMALALLFLRLTGSESPAFFYLSHRRVEDWMVFRLVTVMVLSSTAGILFALGLISQSFVGLIHTQEPPTPVRAYLNRFFLDRLSGWGFLCLGAALFLNRRTLSSYIATGTIPQEFWVFPVAGGLFAIPGMTLIALSLLARIGRLLKEREEFQKKR